MLNICRQLFVFLLRRSLSLSLRNMFTRSCVRLFALRLSAKVVSKQSFGGVRSFASLNGESAKASTKRMFVGGVALGVGFGCYAFSTYQSRVAEEIHFLPTAAAEGVSDALKQKYANTRKRIIDNYEDRIRKMSSPEKVFKYFASKKGPNGEFLMDSSDFLRSICPSAPADMNADVTAPIAEFFKLADDNGDGFISFAEYVFFATLLSLPLRHIEIAFRLFDANGNGEVDRNEFLQVTAALRRQSVIGSKQRTVSSGAVSEDSALIKYLFGADGSKTLKVGDFETFVRKLQTDVLRSEFNIFARDESDTISAHDFGVSIIGTAKAKSLPELMKRAAQLENVPHRVSFEDYALFHEFLHSINEVKLAMNLLSAHDGCTKREFKRIVNAVAKVHLTDHIVDIIFRVFDSNGDQYLDQSEFLDVLEKRTNFGLASSRDVGFISFLQCAKSCMSDS